MECAIVSLNLKNWTRILRSELYSRCNDISSPSILGMSADRGGAIGLYIGARCPNHIVRKTRSCISSSGRAWFAPCTTRLRCSSASTLVAPFSWFEVRYLQVAVLSRTARQWHGELGALVLSPCPFRVRGNALNPEIAEAFCLKLNHTWA